MSISERTIIRLSAETPRRSRSMFGLFLHQSPVCIKKINKAKLKYNAMAPVIENYCPLTFYSETIEIQVECATAGQANEDSIYTIEMLEMAGFALSTEEKECILHSTSANVMLEFTK